MTTDNPDNPAGARVAPEGTDQAGARMAAEIAEQPAALQRLLDDGIGQLAAVAAQIRARGPRFVLLAARGTSDNAALYAKYLIETVTELPAGLASTSTFTGYGSHPDLSDVLWISFSQSGGSPDLVESTEAAKACGALTVAVTNAPDSPLAQASELNVEIMAGPELAVAATKSYTSELLAAYLLIELWSGGTGDAARRLPALASETLVGSDAARLATRYRFADRLVVTSRGYAYATAREAALKLMETSYISAHAFSSADLMHGPMAMVDAQNPVIVVVPPETGGELLGPPLQRLRELEADVLVVGDPQTATWAAAAIPLPRCDERLSPILQILPLQQFAHALALERGFDPDAPRGLRKVTETR